MKKMILLVAVIIVSANVNAQKRNDTSYYSWGRSMGNTIILDNTTQSDPYGVDTAYITPFVRLDNGVRYPIFILSNGKCFIYKIDPEENKPYKAMLPEDINRYIQHRMTKEIHDRRKIEARSRVIR